MSNASDWQLHKLISSAVGAKVAVKEPVSAELKEYLFWFDDLGASEGPLFRFVAEGLHRHRIDIELSSGSRPVINQILASNPTQRIMADHFFDRLRSFGFRIKCNDLLSEALATQTLPETVFSAEKTKIKAHLTNESILNTVQNALIPLICASAELIGYEESSEESVDDPIDGAYEGQLELRIVRARERSRRNRQLCLGFFGEKCFVCGFVPKDIYREAGSIIEVHHKQPVSGGESFFDPKVDLIPLCPNCHRAIHTKRPIPWTPDELSSLYSGCKNDNDSQ